MEQKDKANLPGLPYNPPYQILQESSRHPNLQ